MGHSRAEKAQSRERIVSAAARMIRERGIDAVSIGELMAAAGLTHGGFYVHFESRDTLIAAALERALRDGEAAASAGSGTGSGRARGVKSIVNSYLSRAHRDAPGAGCAVSALSGDVARADERTRAIMIANIDRYLAGMARVSRARDPEAAEAFALAAWSTMVGAVTLARVFAGDPRADKILLAARQAVIDMEAALEG